MYTVYGIRKIWTLYKSYICLVRKVLLLSYVSGFYGQLVLYIEKLCWESDGRILKALELESNSGEVLPVYYKFIRGSIKTKSDKTQIW